MELYDQTLDVFHTSFKVQRRNILNHIWSQYFGLPGLPEVPLQILLLNLAPLLFGH